MLLFLSLVSASLEQPSRDVTNDIIVKQNIFGSMYFLLNFVKLRISKIALKKATRKTCWESVVLTSSSSY